MAEHKLFSLVGLEAPRFEASALMEDNSFNNEFQSADFLLGSYGVIFFYPLDFTYVCPTELIALNNRLKEFQARNAKVIAISTDSHFTHLAWKRTPHKFGGIQNVKFPIVADLTKEIADTYGVIVNRSIPLRGTFITDRDGIVRYQQVNDLAIGRNIDEILRTLDAIQHHENSGNVCPAGWTKGKESVEPNDKGVAEFLVKHAANL
ncbi:MAG: peroxiredoxin [Rickettsiales bacterium]|nr:peroxiredoxin [Rickettsiales bacterium]